MQKKKRDFMNFLMKYRFNPIAIVSAIFLLMFFLIGLMWVLIPPPPKNIEIATGFPTGLYYQFAQRLKSELAHENVNLEIVTTGGTMDNLALLGESDSHVDFAMVQGGVEDISKYPDLVSVAGMFYEPMWIWYRTSAFKADGGRLSVLEQLKGKRVSIGNEGSGTLSLSQALLGISGMVIPPFLTKHKSRSWYCKC